MGHLDFHAFSAADRTRAAGDEGAAKNYDRLATVATEPETRARWHRRAAEARASAAANIQSVNDRMTGRRKSA